MRCRFMSEAARPKMDPDPDAVFFIGEKIDVVISAAHGAKLILRHRFQPTHRLQFPSRIIKQFVFDTRFAFATNAK